MQAYKKYQYYMLYMHFLRFSRRNPFRLTKLVIQTHESNFWFVWLIDLFVAAIRGYVSIVTLAILQPRGPCVPPFLQIICLAVGPAPFVLVRTFLTIYSIYKISGYIDVFYGFVQRTY